MLSQSTFKTDSIIIIITTLIIAVIIILSLKQSALGEDSSP
jgi:hypothetical protein